MKRKRKAILWTAAILLMPLCALLFIGGDAKPTLNVSGVELRSILDENVVEFAGPPRLPFSKALKDSAYLKMRGQLLLGAKLKPLVTTNASLLGLAPTLAFDSDATAVIVHRKPGDLFYLGQFGKFDSGKYARRWSEGRAVRQIIENAGLRVEFLNDGKVALLSTNDYELLITAKSPARQRVLLQQFDQAKDSAAQQAHGTILAHLWHVNYLDEQVKQDITRMHYRLVLRQHTNVDWPSWDVRTEQPFPFPEVYTEFTPTLYCNGQVKWAPGRHQYGGMMNEAGRPRGEGNPITSMSGGEFRNGDVLQCRIALAQKVNGREWNISLWTDKIVLQGLKR